jgi:hypothetical protein
VALTSEKWFLKKPNYIVKEDGYYDFKGRKLYRKIRRFNYDSRLNKELLEVYKTKIIFYFNVKYTNVIMGYNEGVFDFYSVNIKIGKNNDVSVWYISDDSAEGEVYEIDNIFHFYYSVVFFFDLFEASILVFYLNCRPVGFDFIKGLVEHLEYIYYDFRV